MRFVLGLFLLGISIASEGAFSASPEEVFQNSLSSVVWIVSKTKNGEIYGSGVLARHRGYNYVVTNKHVVGDESSIEVFFPFRDSDKNLIVDRNYYLNNRNSLEATEYYAQAEVRALDSERDLALLALTTIPKAAKPVNLSSTQPKRDDRLHIVGNPSGRDLFRWTQGSVDRIGPFDYSFPSGQNVKYQALYVYADIFPGNSGGPALDDKGDLVGIVASVGGEGGFKSQAIHFSEVQTIFHSVRSWWISCTRNDSDAEVTMSSVCKSKITGRPLGPKTDHKIPAKQSKMLFCPFEGSRPAEVTYTSETGSTTNQLEGNLIDVGIGKEVPWSYCKNYDFKPSLPGFVVLYSPKTPHSADNVAVK